MADDDVDGLDDDEQSFLLSGSESVEGEKFLLADGFDVSNLSRSVLGTIAFGIGTAATLFVQGVEEAWTSAINGVTGFIAGVTRLVEAPPGSPRETVTQEIPGLIQTLNDTITGSLTAAWESAVPEAGVATWLFALGIVLATFFVAANGLETIQEVLFG